MEFCPDCGKMLMPNKGKIKCRCGYEKDLSKEDIEEQYHMEGEKNPEMTTGGQSRQDLQMRHLPILYAAPNAAIHGEVPTSMGFPLKYYITVKYIFQKSPAIFTSLSN